NEFAQSWYQIASPAGISLATLGSIVVATSIFVVTAPPVIIGIGIALTLGGITLATVGRNPISKESLKIGEALGLSRPSYGGTAQGSATLIQDGRAYFILLRNLFLAVCEIGRASCR